jgi:adenylyltransferase/sulfurtransferase
MSPGERDRYSRQILFAPIGEAGQEKMRAATASIVGCGALGSFQAEALTRAGIGRLVLIDRDVVELSNLQRQWLYEESDAVEEVPKAIAAARRLARLNADVEIQSHVSDLTPSNAEDLLAGSHIVLDGTDNFETRYLLNDISVKSGTPWIYGAAIGSYGIVMPVVPMRGPCLCCLYPDSPQGIQPTCDVNGVLASATAVVAALQVALALRVLSGWDNFECFVQTIDVWRGDFRRVSSPKRDPECKTCQRRVFRFLEGKRRVPVSLCGRNAVQLHDADNPLDLEKLAHRLRPLGAVRVTGFALRISIPKYEITFFPDGRAIVKGTTDPGVARGLYARLVGS